MTAEMGKPLRESRLEAARGAAILRYFAGDALRPMGERFEQSLTRGSVYTTRRPLGVVGLITPWNFPIAIPAWKLAPALVYGNTCVVKIAYEAPRCGLHLAECLEEADLPPGVANFLTGAGAIAGQAVVDDPRVGAISFTGSTAVGHALRDVAIAAGKRVQLELGGQNPLIVMADAHLGAAVEAAFAGAYWSAGQKCTATRRILVEESAYDDFRTGLLERMRTARVGDPSDPETEVGPLVNEQQLADVLAATAARSAPITATWSRRRSSRTLPPGARCRATRSSVRWPRCSGSPISTRPSSRPTPSSSV
jgi:acyl-CoA reductase-like NAD-dependent aldehyde dehydrogenase